MRTQHWEGAEWQEVWHHWSSTVNDSDINWYQGLSHHKSCSATSHTLFLYKTSHAVENHSQNVISYFPETFSQKMSEMLPVTLDHLDPWKILEGRFPFSWSKADERRHWGAHWSSIAFCLYNNFYGPNPYSSYVTLWTKLFVDSLNSLQYMGPDEQNAININKQTWLFLRDFEGPPLKAAHFLEHIGLLDFDAVAYAQLPGMKGHLLQAHCLVRTCSNPGTWNNHWMWLFVLT